MSERSYHGATSRSDSRNINIYIRPVIQTLVRLVGGDPILFNSETFCEDVMLNLEQDLDGAGRYPVLILYRLKPINGF